VPPVRRADDEVSVPVEYRQILRFSVVDDELVAPASVPDVVNHLFDDLGFSRAGRPLNEDAAVLEAVRKRRVGYAYGRERGGFSERTPRFLRLFSRFVDDFRPRAVLYLGSSDRPLPVREEFAVLGPGFFEHLLKLVEGVGVRFHDESRPERAYEQSRDDGKKKKLSESRERRSRPSEKRPPAFGEAEVSVRDPVEDEGTADP